MVRFAILLILFSLSGLTGLIYESIWTHYLKLYLGHAAYAQTLVLAIFMGGMALGAALCSRFSHKWSKLIIWYAVIEGLIGLLALGFHGVFVNFLSFSYGQLLPALDSTSSIYIVKWLSASLLILPQSILLGATFPLLSAGVLRIFSNSPGASLSFLYFSNSLGGAIGVIASGFFLIKYVGLPGTLLTAGIINILIAIAVWMLFKDVEEVKVEPTKTVAVNSEDKTWLRLLLLTAFITGVASFIYEVTWIRMLSLVLGSSSHAFELMLSAFIFGLAFGGIWIRKRIDNFISPVKVLAFVQILMGTFAILTLYFYNQTFDFMQFVLHALSKTDSGYLLFNILSHGICFLIMLPATFCAGMTLPLITYNLLQKGHGEKVIGSVYAMNTLGAIIGIVLCMQVTMWLLGLKGSIIFGAALDIGMGLVLIAYASRSLWWKQPSYAYAAIALVVLSPLIIQFDANKMMSGVYRNGTIIDSSKISSLYHYDGKTSTVDLAEYKGVIVLRNNGKGDASISMQGETTPDEETQILLAALPMLHMPKPKRAAVIGMGLGMTSHVLLHDKSLQTLDTIEIEKGVTIAASKIRPRNELLFADKRSRIHIEDAKTFFSLHKHSYDIIVSEPSNPWVSGISSLFSTEFYQLIANKLGDHGVFSQWIQVYEIDDRLVASIIKAMLPHFSDLKVYFAANSGDMVVIAKGKGRLGHPDYSLFKNVELAKMLSTLKIKDATDIRRRFAGGRNIVESFVNQYLIAANSDYFPILDQLAVRSRFLANRAQGLLNISMEDLPIVDVLSDYQEDVIRNDETYNLARSMEKYLYGQSDKNRHLANVEGYVELLKIYMTSCNNVKDSKVLFDSIFIMGVATVGRLPKADADALWTKIGALSCNRALSKKSQSLLAFFSQMAKGHYGNAAVRAEYQIELMDKWSQQGEYLLNAALLGYIAEKRYDEAKKFWLATAAKHKLKPGDSLRLLLAQLDKQISAPAIVKN